MRPLFHFFPMFARLLLLSLGFWICACRDNPPQTDKVESEAIPTVTQQEETTDERITELKREIETGRQNINDIEAFAEMERAKLKENPDYDSSFLEQALQEQQQIRETIEEGEKSLKELSPVQE
jgi:vacuolar-type H+-ATPase subunit I/STV1